MFVISMQMLLDVLSRTGSNDIAVSTLQPHGSGEVFGGQPPAVRQVTVGDVVAQIPATSGLGSSAQQLGMLGAQLADIMRTVEGSQASLLVLCALRPTWDGPLRDLSAAKDSFMGLNRGGRF
jgi:hypothetical protein